MLKTKLLAAIAIAIALASPASAQLLENFQVKVGVSAILPDESASIATIGGDVSISDEYVPSLQIEYFFSDAISAELLCCIARHDVTAVGTALGDVNLGKISHFPPTLTLKYHFNTEEKFQPYVGAGVNYTLFFDEKTPSGGPVTGIDYDASFGGALQVGFDYKLDDHWSLNADIRKIWINTDVTIRAGATTINADVDINPYVVTLGTGYRF
jgi:outer membrane protein